ncbi:MAG: TetR/AcrR family transcriptional regulator [Verrucomicrobiae bacterium]|nr:TetR/AcrR family transcriptional regulator [Verrucomicrobiae bacterium]
MRAGRPKAFEQSEVLEKAMHFFWERGYCKPGIAELVGHLGIGRQSLYDTFGSKRDLFIKCIYHYRATQLSTVIRILKEASDPLGRLKEAVRFFEALALDKSARGCLVANAIVEFGTDDPEICALLDETLALLEGGYLDALRRAKRLGQLPPTKKPAHIAKALTNASIGMAVTGRLSKDAAEIRAACAGTLAMLG